MILINLVKLLKKIYVKISAKKDPRFRVSRRQQEKILNKFPNPKDNYQRSYYQYKCQVKMMGFERFIFQIGSLLFFPYLLIKYYLSNNNIESEHKRYDLVCMYSGIEENRLPKSLLENYNNTLHYKSNYSNNLSIDDIKWMFGIITEYPFSWMLHIKLLNKVAQYSYIIRKFSPDAIAVTGEYSCCSSILTEYCNYNNVKHINFMHGEKIFYIRDSFFRFDKCYVWDKHYIDLFKSLRAYDGQFQIEIPPLFINKSEGTFREKDYCYYLAGESHSQLNRIFSSLKILVEKGYSVYVRIHPRWTDRSYVERLSSNYNIAIELENVNINESLMSYKKIISLFSTVLYQAHLLGVPIIIDDLSDSDRFTKIMEADYICFSFPHGLLSNEI